MSSQPSFIQTQRAFVGAIRDPQNHPTPAGIEERRMNIYRDLFYNNVEDFLASTYPVLKNISGEQAWHELVRHYFANHLASTPLFMQMPREFLRYLENEREPQSTDFPFMLELAHYEWTELELATSDDGISMDGINANGDLLNGKPVVSPLARILGYEYPVHLISSDFLPTEAGKQQTFLIVFRDRNDEVEFIELNQVSAALLARLQTQDHSTRDLLLGIARELDHPEPELIIRFGMDLLEDLHKRGVILGTII